MEATFRYQCMYPLYKVYGDVKYGSHIPFPLKAQREDTEYSEDTKLLCYIIIVIVNHSQIL